MLPVLFGALSITHSHYTQNNKSLELLSNLAYQWEHLEKVEKKQFVQLAINKMIVNKVNKDKTPESVEIVDFDVN